MKKKPTLTLTKKKTIIKQVPKKPTLTLTKKPVYKTGPRRKYA